MQITSKVSQVASSMATKDGVSQIASSMATKDGLSRLAGIAQEVKETVVDRGRGQTYTINQLNKSKDSLNAQLLNQKDVNIRLREKQSTLLKERDDCIKEKDALIKDLIQQNKILYNHNTALLITLAKRKEPDQGY